jgi:hypothetical protein
MDQRPNRKLKVRRELAARMDHVLPLILKACSLTPSPMKGRGGSFQGIKEFGRVVECGGFQGLETESCSAASGARIRASRPSGAAGKSAAGSGNVRR